MIRNRIIFPLITSNPLCFMSQEIDKLISLLKISYVLILILQRKQNICIFLYKCILRYIYIFVLNLLFLPILCLSDYVSICHLCLGSQRGRKRPSDHLVLELVVVVTHLVWVPGCEFRHSGTAASTMTLQHFSSPQSHIYYICGAGDVISLLMGLIA